MEFSRLVIVAVIGAFSAGAVLSGLFSWLLVRQARKQTELVREMEQERCAALLAERDRRVAEVEVTGEQLRTEFQNLAAVVLEEKGGRIAEQNRRKVEELLGPFRQQLTDFKSRVDHVFQEETRDRVSLLAEIRHLKDLNESVRADAVHLTNALKGQVRTQGAWGEMILERILEESGLRQGREYQVQESLSRADGGTSRPDVIVHLPEGKDIVIDAKVTLTAYERYCRSESDAERDRQLGLHLAAVKNHVRSLSDKRYENLAGVHSLDFVLLFLPVEGAFMTAITADNELFNQALAKNVILVSPSTLLATLRTVRHIWRYEDQKQNAHRIALQAGRLYDKFVDFAAALDDIGDKLDKATAACDTAKNRLCHGRGNLVRRVEELRHLGAAATKKLPAVLVDRAETAITEE